MSTIVFTGFPGFLGSALLPRVLDRDPDAVASCLVQPKFADLARRRLDELVRDHPTLAGRIALTSGDITAPGLLLTEDAPSKGQITEIYHLAAAYDLSVDADLARRINVAGTDAPSLSQRGVARRRLRRPLPRVSSDEGRPTPGRG